MMRPVELEAEKLRIHLKRNNKLLTKQLILQYEDYNKEYFIITNTGKEIQISYRLHRKLVKMLDAEAVAYNAKQAIEEYTTTRKRLKAALKIIAPTRQELITDILADLDTHSFHACQ
ncbi:MAG: hypothetical protein EOP45_07725 [Sphingobacteriaceae bacterium]|nr:MAG: hypothetical protein EOP45_07725 [Sphingobacteriaceae bacterium]